MTDKPRVGVYGLKSSRHLISKNDGWCTFEATVPVCGLPLIDFFESNIKVEGGKAAADGTMK